MILEVEFSLEDKGVEFARIGTVKWVRFPEFGFGVGVVCFDNLVNSLGKCCSFSIGICDSGSLFRSIIIYRINESAWNNEGVGRGMEGEEMAWTRAQACIVLKYFQLCITPISTSTPFN